MKSSYDQPGEDSLLIGGGGSPKDPKAETKQRKARLRTFFGSSAALVLLILYCSLGRSLTKDDDSDDVVDDVVTGKHNVPPVTHTRPTSVAFIGNSMFYFNDFPRTFQAMSEANGVHVVQDSCLHGGASLESLLLEGNGMYPQFMTPTAEVNETDDSHVIYDFGACTVQQLLGGHDERLKDPGYAQPANRSANNLDPCREDSIYLEYSVHTYTRHSWDYVLINDNTRNPARRSTRDLGLATLSRFHSPMIKESGATPVFLWTHAYSVESVPGREMTGGLEDVANFTSLTAAGVRSYAKLLAAQLPKHQQPRIAPVGLAFLTVHEERLDLWHKLFHSDHIHASPSGTFLQGCIVYHTMFGQMPDREAVLRQHMNFFWRDARMMQHAWEPPNPFPTLSMAKYLYRVAERVMDEDHVPKSYIDYQHDEAVNDDEADS